MARSNAILVDVDNRVAQSIEPAVDRIDGNVRVTTLKLADQRITLEWLRGDPPA